MIYLDNNATTLMSTEAKNAMLEWCNRGNPSSSYASAKEARELMSDFRNYIGKLCNIDPCCSEDRDVNDSEKKLNAARRADLSKYKVLFVSGASEANCTVIQGIVDSYARIKKVTPHIVMSAIEHKSLYELALSLESRNKATVTFINPTSSGHIHPDNVAAAIGPNTCIVCVMHANNETGAINDIAAIGDAAHKRNVPFHCDTVQSFGKFVIDPCLNNIDSFCVSFHKLGGPPGCGALIIKQQLLQGFQIPPLIYGTQNEGLRGGTENLPGIGASFTAMKLTMINRTLKNNHLARLKGYIMDELGIHFPTMQYTQYVKRLQPGIGTEIVFLSGASEYYLQNTLLLSVVKHTKPYICNSQMKADLESDGIVVSVGSACNTSSPKASHVLFGMGADELIRKGALRVSLGDNNTLAEVKKFVTAFVIVIKKQL